MATDKDETAIFFFEEAIKAEPSKIRDIISIAKRSPGYSSSKALQERVLKEESLMRDQKENNWNCKYCDFSTHSMGIARIHECPGPSSKITQYMVIGKTKLPRPGTVCKLSELDGSDYGGPGVLCSSDTLEDGFEQIKANLQYLDSLCEGSIYLVEVDILNVPISAFILCALHGNTYYNFTVKYIAKHQSITSN